MLAYGDNIGHFRDSDIFAAIALLDYLRERGGLSESLGGVVSSWKEEIVVSAFGALWLEFSQFESSKNLRDEFLAALVSVKKFVRLEWVDDIPGSILNRYDVNVVRFVSYSTQEMCAVLSRLEGLFR